MNKQRDPDRLDVKAVNGKAFIWASWDTGASITFSLTPPATKNFIDCLLAVNIHNEGESAT